MATEVTAPAGSEERRESAYRLPAAKSPHSALMSALNTHNVPQVLQALSSIPEEDRKRVILSPSKRQKFLLRTPLQAAAASGNLALFDIIIGAFNKLFLDENGKEKAKLTKERTRAMQYQLKLVDISGANLLMIAASTASVAVFMAITREILPSQARKILLKQDVGGMTYLMYAINPDAMRSGLVVGEPDPLLDEEEGKCQEKHGQISSASSGTSNPSNENRVADSSGNSRPANNTDMNEGREAYGIDPLVPVVKSVLEYAKENLWMPEYRKLLQIRDSWNRSIIEHSIESGRHVVFEEVFSALRTDVYDEELVVLFEIGEDKAFEETSVLVSLKTPGGQKLEELASSKIRHLQKDVDFRGEASTVSSKIQSFIPGNLIVIFQLLLPEVDSESIAPLALLVILCLVAPLWAWGSSLVSTTHPERANTLPRVTVARHLLAFPSMFFWGVGTSTIGQTVFGWKDTGSAAALAVATIIIPALDSFMSGKGARAFYDKTLINFLNFYDNLISKRLLPSCLKPKESWMLDSVEDEDWEHGRIFHPSNSFNASLQRGQDLFGLPLVGDAGENIWRQVHPSTSHQPSPDKQDREEVGVNIEDNKEGN